MRGFLFAIISTFCIQWVCTYKMVLLVLDMSHSQLLFNKRVAEALSDAGNEVTLALISPIADRDISDIKIKNNVKVHIVPISAGLTKAKMEENQENYVFKEETGGGAIQTASMKAAKIVHTCEETVKNKEFLQWLTAQQFDLAYAHMFDVCTVGLIHHAGIPAWIWLNSGSIMDYVAYLVGVPIIPSYVPQTEVFRRWINHDFPDLMDLASKCPLVMANSNDLYDMTRPLLAKVVNIGGVGMELGDAKPLPQSISEIVAKGNGTVLFSFGSITAAHKMPPEWKLAFLEAFRTLKCYQFLVRYEKNDLDDKLPANVHLFKWLPQSDILRHPKTKAFITHGGYNSVQEAIVTGVPLIAIPLFGDQPKNARLVERHGIGRVLHKTEISTYIIVKALKQVIEDQRFDDNAKRLSRMVERKPISANHLLVKWSEFLAEFQLLENLEPAGNKLNFVQYHSLDAILFLSFIVLLLLYVVIKVAIICFSLVFASKRKQKTC